MVCNCSSRVGGSQARRARLGYEWPYLLVLRRCFNVQSVPLQRRHERPALRWSKCCGILVRTRRVGRRCQLHPRLSLGRASQAGRPNHSFKPTPSARLNSGVRHWLEINLNWTALSALVVALFLARFATGVVEGILFPAGSLGQLMGLTLLFVLCLAAFAVFSFRLHGRPFINAAVALGVSIAMGLTLAAMYGSSVQSFPWSVVAVQWAVMALSLVVGVSVGSAARRVSRSSANA